MQAICHSYPDMFAHYPEKTIELIDDTVGSYDTYISTLYTYIYI